MKVALAQINTTIGDFEGTLAKVERFVDEAKKQKAGLIVFPELTATGYPPRDLVEIPEFIDKNLDTLHKISELAEGIQIIVGAVERNTRGQGKPFYNMAVLCRDRAIVARYHKSLLPTYDVFDEGRYFEPGNEVGLWTFARATEETSVGFTPRESPEGAVSPRKSDEGPGERAVSLPATKIGISICEDAWNDQSFWKKRLYAYDPIEAQAKAGADFFLNISSSPYIFGKGKFRQELLGAQARKHRRPLLYVNLVGGNDELVFDGRSLVLNAQGEVVTQAKAYEEDLIFCDLDQISKKKISKTLPEDEESIFNTLVLGLRDYVRKCGFKKVVLGLSGGIDSALTAVIATEALGTENVLGVAMPSPYSSKGSLDDAWALAKNLGIQFVTYPITEIYNAYRKRLEQPIHSVRASGANDSAICSTDEGIGGRAVSPPDLADENIQARIRGNILMTLSNRHGYLVLSTGNKSELAVGYCTLYGDMSGGLAVISDLPKTMVYEMARWYQQKRRPVIPEDTFTKPPSAELRPNQTDQDSLPSYEVLDGILKAYIEEFKSEEEIIRLGFDAGIVRRVLHLVHCNEYKRRQAATGIKVTSKAFGMGRRYPIARKI